MDGDTESTTQARRWHFDGRELDERSLQLSVQGQLVPLHRKPMSVLLHLLQHAGEVVTKDELAEACWPRRVLSESVLTTTINRLRAAIGDHDASLIKTVHGFGYRLAVPVSVEATGGELPERLDFVIGAAVPGRPNWQLVERLGGGGSADVWRIRQDKSGEERVAKFAVSGAALRSLKREITLSRVLRQSLGERPDLLRIVDWSIDQEPFFIEAEYVPAGSLVQWSEAQGGLDSLALALRLDLIAQCADTLAAAHGVGVLHKDLKPSNVLVVADTGGTPRIKLADFGSGGVLDGGALASDITRLGFTQTIAALDTTSGTPLYLSPEVLAGQPVTTQADVYALGVMLYQAVTGDWRKPLAPGWEREVADELLREDIAAAVDGDQARRIADAAELGRRLRHLEARHRSREAERLARERALALQGRLERAEAARRGYLAAAVVLVLGLAVTVALSWRLYETDRERSTALERARSEAAVSEQVSDYLVSLFEAASPEESGGAPIEPRKLVDLGHQALQKHFGKEPQVRARMLGMLGRVYCVMGHTEECRRDIEEALALDGEHPNGNPAVRAKFIFDLSDSQIRAGRYDLAEHSLRQAARLLQEGDVPADSERSIEVQSSLGYVLRALQKPQQSIAVLEALQRTLAAAGQGADSQPAFEALGSLALSYQEAGRTDEALALSQKTVDRVREVLGPDNIQYLYQLDYHGYLLYVSAHYTEAEAARRELLARYEKLYAPTSYHVTTARNNLAAALRQLGRVREAVPLFRRVIADERSAGAPDGPDMGQSLANLGRSLAQLGDSDEALPLLRDALAMTEKAEGANGFQSLRRRLDLADVLIARGSTAEARALLLNSEVAQDLDSTAAQLERARRERLLGNTELAEGRLDDAERHFAAASAAYERNDSTSYDARALTGLGQARLRLARRQAKAAIDQLVAIEADLRARLVADAPLLLEVREQLAQARRS
ncbi:tetratricopeptide repeat protein [Hydrocarboniphaga effusa]|uniref:tetratricopeptide repeat protein n=1 Tax=Hydrocarboniphaga effusa TaxID=243629 RepID=UPI00398BE529